MTPWTPEEMAIARSPLPLAVISERLPWRTYSAIKRKRLGCERLPTDYAALGRRSGEARRLVSTDLKNRFIAAVAAGAGLTKTGVVARSTYLAWKKADAAFFEWLATFKARPSPRRAAAEHAKAARMEARREARAAVAAQKTRQAAKVVRSLDEMLRGCDVYEVARRAIGEVQPRFVRDEAISGLVMALLEGEVQPVNARASAAKFVRMARKEVSYVSADAPVGRGPMSLADLYSETAEIEEAEEHEA